MNSQYKEIYELSETTIASYLRNNLDKGEGYNLCFNDFGLAQEITIALCNARHIEYVPTHERVMIILELLVRLTNSTLDEDTFPACLSFEQELVCGLADTIKQSVFWVAGGHQTLTYPLVLQAHKENSSLGLINKGIEAEIISDAQLRNSKRKNHVFSMSKVLNSLISLWRRQ